MTFRQVYLVPVLAAALAVPARAQDGPASNPPERPVVTVVDFETDRTGWMPPPHFGETLADMLTDRLVTAGSYRVVDRAWIARTDAGGARVPLDVLRDRAVDAGVDYLMVGAVVRLSTERRSSTGGGVLPLPVVGGLLRRHRTASVVGLAIRVVDVRTGEVVATAGAERDASASTTTGGGIALVGKVPVIGAKGSSATGIGDGLLDRAARQALDAAAEQLLAAAARLRPRAASGSVSSATGPSGRDPGRSRDYEHIR